MTGPSYFSMASRKTKTMYQVSTQFHHSLLTTPLTHIQIPYTHTNAIHHTNVLFTIIQLNFPQVMDSQVNELLDEIHHEEMIFLSGGESDDNLFGNDDDIKSMTNKYCLYSKFKAVG